MGHVDWTLQPAAGQRARVGVRRGDGGRTARMSDEQQAPAPPEIAELPETFETLDPAADAYGQPLAPQREQELQNLLDAWNAPDADHGERRGPFDGVRLMGAEVSWLVNLRSRAQLQGANLTAAQLEEAILERAQLQGADLTEAQLEGANLR